MAAHPARLVSSDHASSLEEQLIGAFAYAVQGETRFGARADVRPELDARWRDVIMLIQQLSSVKRGKRVHQ